MPRLQKEKRFHRFVAIDWRTPESLDKGSRPLLLRTYDWHQASFSHGGFGCTIRSVPWCWFTDGFRAFDKPFYNRNSIRSSERSHRNGEYVSRRSFVTTGLVMDCRVGLRWNFAVAVRFQNQDQFLVSRQKNSFYFIFSKNWKMSLYGQKRCLWQF